MISTEDKRVMNDIIQQIKEINRCTDMNIDDLCAIQELSNDLIEFIEPFINNNVKDTKENP